MTTKEREYLINFCIAATAELHGMLPMEIDPTPFEALSDETLEREADWLDEMLNK